MKSTHAMNLALAALATMLASPTAAQTEPAPGEAEATVSAPTPSPPAPAANPQTPAPAAPPPATPPTPYAFPPGYAYPPGHPYPQGYPAYPPGAHPQGYPAYPPAYPQGYPPGTYQPPPAPEPPPSPPPSGKLRLGASIILAPQGNLKYELEYRGEALDSHAGGTSATGGVSAFVEYDVIRHLFVGAALQIMPSLKWQSPSKTSSNSVSYGGSVHAFDLLPQVGISLSPTPRLRVLAYAAPGYSLLDSSSLHGFVLPVALGTMHGFVLQAGGGVQYAFGQHGFFAIRGFYQRASYQTQIKSSTTGQSAEAQLRATFFGVHGCGGYWF